MLQNVLEDVRRCHRRETSPTAWDVAILILGQFGLLAVVVYRMGRWLRHCRRRPVSSIVVVPLYPFYWLLVGYVRLAYDIRIEQNADIGPGLFVGHFGGIVIRNCEIGRNCSVGHQVKIDAPVSPAAKVSIGDNVWIGAHAQICIPIQIGSGATVGAGAVVSSDVPPMALVLGRPARVARAEFNNHGLL